MWLQPAPGDAAADALAAQLCFSCLGRRGSVRNTRISQFGDFVSNIPSREVSQRCLGWLSGCFPVSAPYCSEEHLSACIALKCCVDSQSAPPLREKESQSKLVTKKGQSSLNPVSEDASELGVEMERVLAARAEPAVLDIGLGACTGPTPAFLCFAEHLS